MASMPNFSNTKFLKLHLNCHYISSKIQSIKCKPHTKKRENYVMRRVELVSIVNVSTLY